MGSVSQYGKGHYHLPDTVPHWVDLAALGKLGVRAALATTAVGVNPGVALGQPVVFDELFYPDNFLPDGSPCTVLRRLEIAAGDLGLEAVHGGVYGHVNGSRFNIRAEIRWLGTAGVTAVSQTCGPEVVLAGELGLSYGLVGFPVNYATGIAEPEPKEELDCLLALSARVLSRLVLRVVETLEEQDFAFDHGYVYRIERGIGQGGA